MKNWKYLLFLYSNIKIISFKVFIINFVYNIIKKINKYRRKTKIQVNNKLWVVISHNNLNKSKILLRIKQTIKAKLINFKRKDLIRYKFKKYKYFI